MLHRVRVLASLSFLLGLTCDHGIINAQMLDDGLPLMEDHDLEESSFFDWMPSSWNNHNEGSSSFFSDWWNQIRYKGEKLQVVDMHLHTGLWEDLPPSFQESLLEMIPAPFNCPLLAEPFVNVLLSAYGIWAQLVCSRVSKAVLLAVYAPDTTGLASNMFVEKQIRKKPNKLYGLASLPVDNWDTKESEHLNLLREFLKKDHFLGVKMAHPHMQINLNDPIYYSIYGVAAEFEKPVLVHLGLAATEGSFTNKEATHPDFIEEAIQLYPNVKFLLGHMGNKANFDGLQDPYDACFRLAVTYPNVYLEASAMGSPSNDPDGENLLYVYRTAKELGLVTRMVYGSDGPQFPGFVQSYLGYTLTAMERADYSFVEARAVLFDNFRDFFGVYF